MLSSSLIRGSWLEELNFYKTTTVESLRTPSVTCEAPCTISCHWCDENVLLVEEHKTRTERGDCAGSQNPLSWYRSRVRSLCTCWATRYSWQNNLSFQTLLQYLYKQDRDFTRDNLRGRRENRKASPNSHQDGVLAIADMKNTSIEERHHQEDCWPTVGTPVTFKPSTLRILNMMFSTTAELPAKQVIGVTFCLPCKMLAS
jgi:hypothetical protein